jgi:hypothetical protein
LVGAPHALDNLLALLLIHTAVLGDDLSKNLVDFTRHVGRIAADVEVGFLQQKLIDFGRALAQAVLHVDLLVALAGEGGDDFEGVAEGGLVLLLGVESVICEDFVVGLI